MFKIIHQNGEILNKVSTATYNTKVGELVAATSAVDQKADLIDSRLTATTVAFLGGEEFDPAQRYVEGDNVVVTNVTTKETLQYECSVRRERPQACQ